VLVKQYSIDILTEDRFQDYATFKLNFLICWNQLQNVYHAKII